MAKILIPRSDSVDVKIIEPSDFESFFSGDWMNDYVKSGFTLSAGSGLSVNIAVGLGRLKGLFINNSTSSSKGSLSANTTNYIYVTLARDSNSQAESWSFTSNTSGTTAADSLFIGTAVTNGSGVTSVDDNNIETQAITGISEWGDGSDGNVTLSSSTALSGAKYYNNLTINSGVTVTGASPIIIFARGTVTINGTITPDRTAGGAGGSGGAGGDATTNNPDSAVVANVGKSGNSGVVGGVGFIHDNYAGAGGGSGGASGSNTSGGAVNNGGNGAAGVPLQSATPSQLMTKIRTSILTNPNSKGGGGSGGSGGSGGGSGSAYCNPSGFNGGNGGAGGAGGGSIIIIAPTIIFNSGSSINSNGLAGTNGNAGGNGNNCTGYTSGVGQRYASGGGGGGGGGHGGHGGSIMFLYKSLTDSGTATVAGGAHGNGGAAGSGGSSTYSYGNGSDGNAGNSGSGGGTGTLIKLDVS